MSEDIYFMKLAIEEAKKAYKNDEVPVGAIIVKNNKILSKSYNKIEKKKCSIFHAEINAIKNANKKIKSWRLNDCTLYVTMEPCMMCCGAILQSRIKKIVYGVSNKNFGCTNKLNNVIVVKNICEEECKKILTDFFEKKR